MAPPSTASATSPSPGHGARRRLAASTLRGMLAILLCGALAPGAQAEEAAPEHRLAVYTTLGAQFYLSDARTIGGIGGGVGVRDTVRERFLLQTELSYLPLLGNTFSLRLAAGVQRSGMYCPALLATLTVLAGDGLTFLTPRHPTALNQPAMALGLVVAPLRFTWEGTQLSVLQLGVGAGSDWPGLGVQYQLGLAEIAIAL